MIYKHHGHCLSNIIECLDYRVSLTKIHWYLTPTHSSACDTSTSFVSQDASLFNPFLDLFPVYLPEESANPSLTAQGPQIH